MKWFVLFFFFHVNLLFGAESVLLHIDFKGVADTQDATQILKEKGIGFEMEKEKFSFSIKNEILYIETYEQGVVVFGKILKKQEFLENPRKVVIEWGVERFPEGASWDEGINRLPIGLIMVFGDKKLPSGIGFLAPKVPPFLCPFIGEKESLEKVYKGKLYKKGGRYYCVSNEKDRLIRTTFDIEKRYKEAFGTLPPPISAFAFQINTKNTHGGAKSFLKSVTFYK